MENDFDDVPPGIKSIVVHVAEFSCVDNEYIEGPRLLAVTTTYDATENIAERTTFYTNGVVHSRVVTTGAEEQRRSIIYRYRLDGHLRDKWLITYNSDATKAHVGEFDSHGKLHEVPFEEEEEIPIFDFEQVVETENTVKREFDVRGNWIRETRFEKKFDRGELLDVPIMVIYRTITYL
ncbi:MAG TPA: hypothetical protein VFS76_16935 [Pyrinomonadaceae bacterium]|nr:hypothetical protein [Pyrinomonadaceae bacterium]